MWNIIHNCHNNFTDNLLKYNQNAWKKQKLHSVFIRNGKFYQVYTSYFGGTV